MQKRPHRSAMELAIGQLLMEWQAEAIERGIIANPDEPAQLDLFATPTEARLFKRGRGRPPWAARAPKWRRR
ncbi:MAG: hypothetical protein JO305_05025 [Alphaproteobacteria bacterium]|nr:hypothetical protein [Alphaproteobacteria bacterium]